MTHSLFINGKHVITARRQQCHSSVINRNLSPLFAIIEPDIHCRKSCPLLPFHSISQHDAFYTSVAYPTTNSWAPWGLGLLPTQIPVLTYGQGLNITLCSLCLHSPQIKVAMFLKPQRNMEMCLVILCNKHKCYIQIQNYILINHHTSYTHFIHVLTHDTHTHALTYSGRTKAWNQLHVCFVFILTHPHPHTHNHV